MKILDPAIREERVRMQRRLIEARAAAGLSQAELARQLGVQQSMVSCYESGRSRLDMVDLARVLRVLRLDPGTFFASTGPSSRGLLRPVPDAGSPARRGFGWRGPTAE